MKFPCFVFFLASLTSLSLIGVKVNCEASSATAFDGHLTRPVLRKWFPNFEDTETINVGDQAVKSVDAQLFAGTDLSKVKFIYLRKNEFTKLDENLFQSANLSTALREIHLDNTMLKALNEPGLFAGLGKLVNLFCYNSKIGQLHPKIFNDLVKLQELALERNELKRLDANQFQGMTELRELYLSRNRLEALESTLFKGLTKLTHLDISSNRVPHLDVDLFADLSSLIYLKLADNEITHLEPLSFRTLGRVDSLDLSSNQIKALTSKTFRGLDKIVEIFLQGNSITSCGLGTFKLLTTTLKSVNFLNNPIAITGLEHLKSVCSYDFYCVTTANEEQQNQQGGPEGLNYQEEL